MNNPTLHWQTLLSTAQSLNKETHNRFAQLATIQSGKEPRPAVRTVTVRFFLDDGRLLITTDRRNEKVTQLAENPACELCWYFTETREQFRLSGRAHVVCANEAKLEAKLDEAMQRTWNARSHASQQSSTWPQPNKRLDDSALFAAERPLAPNDDFALVLIEIISVDYLNLMQHPHQRVLFNKLAGQWMPRAINP